MRKDERLFAALSGVDEELLERSERRTHGAGRWMAWGAALAACLSVVLLVYGTAPEKAGPDVPPPLQADDLPAAGTPDGPDVPTANEKDHVPPQFTKAEKLHLLQICMDQERKAPKFTIWYNEEIYYAFQQGDVYTIKPAAPPQVPDGELPECKLEIEYKSGSMDEIAEEVLGRLKGLYRSAEEGGCPAFPEETRYFRAGSGTDWNSAQREVWLLPAYEDGEPAGAFVCSASYFLEAEEGHGVRFLDMVRSFRVVEEDGGDGLAWMSEAFDAAGRMLAAVTSDDLAGVEDMLAPDADVYGYGEDVYGSVSMGSTFIAFPDGYDSETAEEPPGALNVSVQFRLGGEDAYEFLTMEMICRDGRWLVTWAGLER